MLTSERLLLVGSSRGQDLNTVSQTSLSIHGKQCSSYDNNKDPFWAELTGAFGTYNAGEETPSGAVVNSYDFSNNHFNLLLTNPVQGGNYTCRVPPQHADDACLHGNHAGHVQASVYVDRVDDRLSLLEKENKQVKQENKQLQNRLQELEDRTRQQIGFHATHLQSQTPPAGTPIIVYNVHYNHGNAYSGTTGYFTAPYPGVFFFAATTGSGRAGDIAYHSLYVDNTELSQAFTYEDSTTSGVSTAHAVVHLTTGQRVWVKSGGNNYFTNEYTSFSGFLISPYP